MKKIKTPVAIIIIVLCSVIVSWIRTPKYSNFIKAIKENIVEDGLDIENEYDENGVDSAINYIDEKLKSNPNSAYLYNKKGMYLMELDEYEDAIECFHNSNKYSNGDDSALNNLCWAYNTIGENDKALEYGKEALKIKPNTESEYVNVGNVYFAFDEYDKAEESYNLALKLDKDYSYAIYGLGLCSYYQCEYETAEQLFLKYIEILPDDIDGYINLANIYIETGNYESAKYYIELAEGIDSDYTDIEKCKGYYCYYIGDYEESIEYYNSYLSVYPYDYDALYNAGDCLYNLGSYYESIDYYNEILTIYPEDISSRVMNAYNYAEIGEFEKAFDICNLVLDEEEENCKALNAIGYTYISQTDYIKSQEYFKRAYIENNQFEIAYENMAYALYMDKNYSECIEFSKEVANKFPNNYEFLWYIGDCYSSLYESENAIDYYLKTLELLPQDDYLLSIIALEYYSLQDYENSLKYANESLDLNTDNYIAQGLISELDYCTNQSLNKQIRDFVKENYLYINQIEEFDEKSEEFLNKESINGDDINEYINKVKLNDDIYTFVIYGDEYDEIMGQDNSQSIYYANDEIDEDVNYFYIQYFGYNTYGEFRDYLNNIDNTEESVLVLDLRDNFGGMTESANNILDTLLPNCATSFLIDRDGYIDTYYSGESLVKFEKIYILVNENTASSAEILTLSLKKYLPDVTIIGTSTFGKGVGQTIFDNKEKKCMIYLVNFYWNVKETNVTNTKIIPDIYVDSDSIYDYLNKINL